MQAEPFTSPAGTRPSRGSGFCCDVPNIVVLAWGHRSVLFVGGGGRKETGKVNVGGNKTNQRIRFSFSSLVFPAGKGAMMGPVASVRASKPRFGLVLAVVIVVVSSCGRGDHALLGGVAGNPQYLPRADILQPEPDEAMLTESGGLLLLFQVFDWESGRMRVKVRMMRSPCTPQHALSAQIP